MFQAYSPMAGLWAGVSAVALTVSLGIASATAQTAARPSGGPTGHIDFSSVDLPPATVEVDLSQDIFGDLFGLGDAAISGAIESLVQSNASQNSKPVELAAGQLAAARQILQLSKEVIQEVHVRVYDKLAEEQGNAAKLATLFDQQLTAGEWDSVVKVNDGDDSVRVSFLRVEGSILGVFAIVADGKDIVLVNLVCDVSPENVKKLSAAATKIGLELGLREAIERELGHRVQ